MKKIVLLSQKGGSGKSTVSIGLSCEFEKHDLQTLLLDADPQATAYKWSKKRDSDIPYVLSVQPASIPETLEKYDSADICIIDTAGHSSTASIEVAKLADIVLIPTRPTSPDLEAIQESINVAKLAGVPAYVLVNALHHSAKSTHVEIQELIKSSFGVETLNSPVCQRSAYAHCMIEGKSPQEYDPQGRCVDELEALFTEIKALL